MEPKRVAARLQRTSQNLFLKQLKVLDSTPLCHSVSENRSERIRSDFTPVQPCSGN